jgi:hypothetical protein
VQFEGVGTITVGGVAVQVLRQVDDHDGLKGAFLRVCGKEGGQRITVISSCPHRGTYASMWPAEEGQKRTVLTLASKKHFWVCAKKGGPGPGSD